MCVQRRGPVFLCRSLAAAAVGLVLAAGPANAERWHELASRNGNTTRLDLDSLARAGDEVTYRAEFSRRVDGQAKRGIVVAVVDCEKGLRKPIEKEEFLANGTSRKSSISVGWQKVEPFPDSKHILDYVCKITRRTGS